MNTLKKFNQNVHILNHDEIDTLHKEFLDIYNSTDINSLESIRLKTEELLIHSIKHFHDEEILMEKYDYPNIKEHKDEHNKALAEIKYFMNNSHSTFGKKMLKSYFIEKLPEWFDFHLSNMDSDLVYYLNKLK